MTDFLTWSPVNLGRWGGAQVRAHVLLLGFAATALLNAALGPGHHVLHAACWLSLLLAALAVHELGHGLMTWWLDAEPEDVHIWPLGNLVGPTPGTRPGDHFILAVSGVAANFIVVVICSFTLALMHYRIILNPFGNHLGTGAPILVATNLPTSFNTPAWWIGWFGYLNMVILLANLIPALPFDGGRMVRSYLAHASVTPAKDNLLPPVLSWGIALLIFIGGLLRLLLQNKVDGVWLIMIAVLIGFIVRIEARMLDEGGFFEDGVFGYDFSEGYTSLESNAAKVRPYRESAMKRWRRRRSDLRRQRRQEKEAAEDRRMDEILDKIHREGRSALTDEETRFLVRVSAKFRNRPRAHE